MPVIETTPAMVKKVYETTRKNLAVIRKRLARHAAGQGYRAQGHRQLT